MKVVLAPRTKRKIKKLLKSKWIKAVLLSFAVFGCLLFLSWITPVLLTSAIAGDEEVASPQTFFKIALLVNVIIYPLWFKQCLTAVERREAVRRTSQRRHKKTTQKSDM